MRVFAFASTLLVAAFLSLSGCSGGERPQTPGTTADSAEGITKTITTPNGITVTATYRLVRAPRPAEYQPTPDSVYATFTVEYAKDEHEVISPAFLGDRYSEVVQTADYRMDQYVSLLDGSGQELPLINYTVDKTYGLGVGNHFLFVFTAPKNHAEGLSFYIREWGLECGQTTFKY